MGERGGEEREGRARTPLLREPGGANFVTPAIIVKLVNTRPIKASDLEEEDKEEVEGTIMMHILPL